MRLLCNALSKRPFLLFLSILSALYTLPSELAQAATYYYVRPDGGTFDQCTGLVDAPYQGSGTNQPCAWSHPFWALDSNNPPSWRLQGGDTLIIYQGSYRMGIGAPNTGWCEAESSYDCHLAPLPSGPDPAHPTRILGADWDQGCPNPPELWGAERPWQIISLNGTSNGGDLVSLRLRGVPRKPSGELSTRYPTLWELGTAGDLCCRFLQRHPQKPQHPRFYFPRHSSGADR